MLQAVGTAFNKFIPFRGNSFGVSNSRIRKARLRSLTLSYFNHTAGRRFLPFGIATISIWLGDYFESCDSRSFTMRNNTMTKCAVEAMLFVGTLGASAQAATVTLIDNFQTGFGSGWSSQSGAGILGTREVDTQDGLSFQNPGLKLNASLGSIGGGVRYSNFGTLDFTNLALTMTGSGGATGNAVQKVVVYNSNMRSASWNVAFSNSMTMSTSDFTHTDIGFDPSNVIIIEFFPAGLNNGTVNYTMTNFSYSAVPAPGAVALLGVSGLVAVRRRRA